MFLLVSCTSLAVLSVLLPGSPLHLPGVWPGPAAPPARLPWTLAGLATAAFWRSYCSVLVFLAGIILARFGLWIVDLTVNQLLQEKVGGRSQV
jgi:iron-regulated transporter 1